MTRVALPVVLLATALTGCVGPVPDAVPNDACQFTVIFQPVPGERLREQLPLGFYLEQEVRGVDVSLTDQGFLVTMDAVCMQGEGSMTGVLVHQTKDPQPPSVREFLVLEGHATGSMSPLVALGAGDQGALLMRSGTGVRSVLASEAGHDIFVRPSDEPVPVPTLRFWSEDTFVQASARASYVSGSAICLFEPASAHAQLAGAGCEGSLAGTGQGVLEWTQGV